MISLIFIRKRKVKYTLLAAHLFFYLLLRKKTDTFLNPLNNITMFQFHKYFHVSKGKKFDQIRNLTSFSKKGNLNNFSPL